MRNLSKSGSNGWLTSAPLGTHGNAYWTLIGPVTSPQTFSLGRARDHSKRVNALGPGTTHARNADGPVPLA
jgi:hypothetical protein